MSNFIITYPNSADPANGGVVTAGSEAGGYPATNLQTQALTSPWRSVSGDVIPGGAQTCDTTGVNPGPILYPSTRSIVYNPTFNLTLDPLVGLVGLYAHNARPSGAFSFLYFSKWRVRAFSALYYAFDRCIRPSVIVLSAASNLTGTVAAVADSPWLPDGTWLTATVSTVATSGVFWFSPSATDGGNLALKTGAGVQYFNLWLRRSAAGGTDPTVRVELFEANFSRGVLCTGVSINSTTGVLLSVPWNASALTSLTTTNNVQVKITTTPGTASSVDFGAVEWLAEHTGYSIDSGDMTVAYPPLVTRDTRSFGLTYVLPTPVAVQQTIPGGFTRLVVDQVFTHDAYTQAGSLIVADTFSPVINMDYDWSVGWGPDPSVLTRSVGGQLSADKRQKFRVGEFACKALRQTEADAVTWTIEALQGMTGNLVWVPDPSNTAGYYNYVMYGRLSDLSPTSNPRFQRFAKTFKIEELL